MEGYDGEDWGLSFVASRIMYVQCIINYKSQVSSQ
jgi:hypothetical protein